MTTRKTKFSIVQINGLTPSLALFRLMALTSSLALFRLMALNKIVDAKIVSVITAPMIKQKLNLDKYRNNCENLSMVDIPKQHSDICIDVLIGND